MDSLAKNKACNEECPVKKTAEIIEGKWTTLVIFGNSKGFKRYQSQGAN